MIRSIIIPKVIDKAAADSSATAFEALARFLADIGLDAGHRWHDSKTGVAGQEFTAPGGCIELLTSDQPIPSEIILEVSGIDELHAVALRHGLLIRKPIHDAEWGARMFDAELPGGTVVTFMQYLEPKKLPYQNIEGNLRAAGRKFGIVVSRFNSFITERLLQGALDALHRTGAADADITVVHVPGAFEIPGAARLLAETGTVHAVICLGCLLRGDTSHYDHLANEVTRGIGQSAQETGVPHSYGVLTCDTLVQAIDRAGLKSGNKGFEAAISAIEMCSVAAHLQPPALKKRTH